MSGSRTPPIPLCDRPGKPFVALSGELPDPAVLAGSSGIGLIRSEYIVRASGAYWTRRQCRRMVARYVEGVLERTRGGPVWYRLSDLEARDVNVLDGCDVAHHDDNPIIGLRGLRRVAIARAGLEWELRTFAELARCSPRLGLQLPFCRDVEQIAYGIEQARAAGYGGPIGVMIEVPSAAYQVEEIMDLGVDHCLVGLNDLTGLLLGSARTAPDYDQTHPTVLRVLRNLYHVGERMRIPVRFAGNYGPELPAALPEFPASAFVVHYCDWGELVDRRLTDYADRDLVRELRRRSDEKLVAAGLLDESDAVVIAGIKPHSQL